ncbi:hypothetical protein NBRC116591_20610 [Sessilibacter corallicola]|uniref:N-acetyltransferase domain-containing protein n=1 Tax=Sessilibacter corallicola TaxID=2904075 RepID=A0ABQ0A9C3_9GAMM
MVNKAFSLLTGRYKQTKMNIHAVEEKDLEDLKRIAKAALFHSVDAPDDEKERLLPHILNDIEKAICLDEKIYLKYVGSEIQGFILIKHYWNLSQLFIDPKFQSLGLGGALLTEALLRIRNRENSGYVRLNSSDNAVGFYQKYGFVQDNSRQPKSKWSVPMEIRF